MIRQRATFAADLHPQGCSCTRCAAPTPRISALDRVAVKGVIVIGATVACWLFVVVAARAAFAAFGG